MSTKEMMSVFICTGSNSAAFDWDVNSTQLNGLKLVLIGAGRSWVENIGREDFTLPEGEEEAVLLALKEYVESKLKERPDPPFRDLYIEFNGQKIPLYLRRREDKLIYSMVQIENLIRKALNQKEQLKFYVNPARDQSQICMQMELSGNPIGLNRTELLDRVNRRLSELGEQGIKEDTLEKNIEYLDRYGLLEKKNGRIIETKKNRMIFR